jgi:hypothetical protein
VSVKRKSKSPSGNWTVSDLKKFIREKTQQARQKIKEFEELEYKGKAGRFFRESIKKLKKASGSKTKNPYDISLGLGKKKKDLMEQAKELEKFTKRKSTYEVAQSVEKQRRDRIERATIKADEDFDRNGPSDYEEWVKWKREEDRLASQPEQIPEQEYEYVNEEKDLFQSQIDAYNNTPYDDAKKERAYNTFNERYYHGTLTRTEYDNLIDTWNAVKDYMKSFGYERRSGDFTPATNADISGNIQDYAEIYTPEEIAEGMREVAKEREKKAHDEIKPEYWTPQTMLIKLDEYLKEHFGEKDEE